MAGMADLFTNKLFLQYLSNLGQGIEQGNVAGSLNQVTQQNIQTQNYHNWLKTALESGGKMSVDAENFSLKAPSNALAGMLGTGNPSSYTPANQGLPTIASRMGGANPQLNQTASSGIGAGVGTGVGTGPGQGMAQLFQMLLGGAGAGNPPSSPLGNMTPSDLAGLTPEHLNSVLQMRMMQDEAGQNALMNRVKMMQALQGIMTPEDVRTADMKNYEYAVQQGYQGSFDDFVNQQTKDTAGIRDYEYARQQGYTGTYEQWKTDLAKLGGTNINLSPYEQTAQRERAKQQTSVMGPEFIPGIRKEVSERLEVRMLPEGEREQAINKIAVEEADKRIRSQFPDAMHGIVNGVLGWWRPDGKGGYELIQRNTLQE